ncbi:hypothetical protein [Tateyamaria sp. ANG-S1]|uniref:hypothetical protein n=1 Tax=Tateyamaria sp. ANG-S1 TaxID=1577905 RepID=UPI00126A6909|nr:hypothetical protein [Tateyamaria sp. ANG-S1]
MAVVFTVLLAVLVVEVGAFVIVSEFVDVARGFRVLVLRVVFVVDFVVRVAIFGLIFGNCLTSAYSET